MSRKKRILRILLIAFLLLLFIGFFAFKTWLFNPLEDDYRYDVSALIKRDVDFYISKAHLAEDFDEFPSLAVMDRVEGTEAWAIYRTSVEYGDFLRDNNVDSSLADLRSALEQIPLGMGALDVIGGRDIALAGYFGTGGIETADWTVYARVNWAGKLVTSLLAYPDTIGLSNQGLSAVSEGGVTTLSGGQLERPLHIARVADVVIVGTSKELTSAAIAFGAEARTDSLFVSAQYHDHIRQVSRSNKRDELEIFFDVRKFLAGQGLFGSLPDVESDHFTDAFFGRLFQLPACKEVVGIMGMDGGFALDLHGDFASDQLSSMQSRLYATRGADRRELIAAASLAPADCAFFMYIKGPISDLLRAALDSAEPALRSNLEDTFRSTGRYNNLDELIEDFDKGFKNRLAIIARPNDYEEELFLDDDGKVVMDPNTGKPKLLIPRGSRIEPVYAITVVGWLDDEERVEMLRDLIGENPTKFGLQGSKPGEPGFYSHTVRDGGYVLLEYFSRFIPGTGVIATANDGGMCISSNRVEMVGHVLKTQTQGTASRGSLEKSWPRLSERSDFKALLNSSLPDANLLLWINPRTASYTMLEQAAEWASLEASRSLDYSSLRREAVRKLLPTLFPGKQQVQLNEQEEERLNEVVDDEVRMMSENLTNEQAIILKKSREREISYLRSVSAMLVMLRLDRKDFDLSVRTLVPLEQVDEGTGR